MIIHHTPAPTQQLKTSYTRKTNKASFAPERDVRRILAPLTNRRRDAIINECLRRQHPERGQ